MKGAQTLVQRMQASPYIYSFANTFSPVPDKPGTKKGHTLMNSFGDPAPKTMEGKEIVGHNETSAPEPVGATGRQRCQ